MLYKTVLSIWEYPTRTRRKKIQLTQKESAGTWNRSSSSGGAARARRLHISNVKNAAPGLVTVRATRSSIFLFSRDRAFWLRTRRAPGKEPPAKRRRRKTRGVSGRAASTKRCPLPNGPLPLLGDPLPRGSQEQDSVGPSRRSPYLAGPKKTGRHGPDHEIAR